MKGRHIIIRPPKRKFSKQMEISKGRGKKHTHKKRKVAEMKARAHTLVILSFHSQMHYQRGLFPPARSELHSSGGHTSSNLPAFKVQRGRQAWPPAGSLGSIFISFQGMSVNLDSCTDKKIFTMPTEG